MRLFLSPISVSYLHEIFLRHIGDEQVSQYHTVVFGRHIGDERVSQYPTVF